MLWKPTRRQIIRTGVLIAAPAIIGRALAQVSMTGAGLGAPGGSPPPSTATFDPAQKFQVTLSGGNLTATNSVGSGSFGNARGTTSQSTGKFYIEWTVTIDAGNQCGIGLSDTTQSFGSGFFNGGVAHSMGTTTISTVSRVSYNGSTLVNYSSSGATTGDVIGMAVDIGGGLVWVRANAGGWNNDIIANQNPALGIGGVSTSLSGALFLSCDVESNTVQGILNTGGSAYVNTAPVGFGNWT